MAKAKEFPKTIYVSWEDPGGSDDWWLSAQEVEADLAERDEKRIAVYTLKEIHSVKLVTTTKLVTKEAK